MPVTLPFTAFLEHLAPTALWALVMLLVLYNLRKAITATKALEIVSTDGVLSGRQVLAWVMAIWTMCMYYAERMSIEGVDKMFTIIVGMYLVGQVNKGTKNIAEGMRGSVNITNKVDAEKMTMNQPGAAAKGGSTDPNAE
jgi:hypothetical protein